jgi:hypothetical protein
MTQFVYVVDNQNECIEKIKKSTIIAKDSDSSYIPNYGNVLNMDIYNTEEEAKTSLRTLLQNRLLIIQARLSRL